MEKPSKVFAISPFPFDRGPPSLAEKAVYQAHSKVHHIQEAVPGWSVNRQMAGNMKQLWVVYSRQGFSISVVNKTRAINYE